MSIERAIHSVWSWIQCGWILNGGMFGWIFGRRNSHGANHTECEKKSCLRSLFPGMWCVLTSLHRYFCENVRSKACNSCGTTQGILYRQSRNVAHAVRWHAFCPRRAITAAFLIRFSVVAGKWKYGIRVSHFIVNYSGWSVRVCARSLSLHKHNRDHTDPSSFYRVCDEKDKRRVFSVYVWCRKWCLYGAQLNCEYK